MSRLPKEAALVLGLETQVVLSKLGIFSDDLNHATYPNAPRESVGYIGP